MRKYIYILFGLFYFLVLMVMLLSFDFSYSAEFNNDIIMDGSVVLNVGEINDYNSFKKEFESIIKENDLYIVRKIFTQENNEEILTYYINDQDMLKGITYYDNKVNNLNGNKYVSTVKNEDTNMVGYKRYYKEKNIKIMDLNSNLDSMSLKGEYYIFSPIISDYNELFRSLQKYSDYMIEDYIPMQYNILANILTISIIFLLFLIILYMIVFYEKERRKKIIINLLYGKRRVSILKNEYLSIMVVINIISICMITLINLIYKIHSLNFLVQCIIFSIIFNILISLIIYILILIVENKEIISYIKNKRTYKIRKVDYIIKFILSLFIVLIISIISFNFVYLKTNLDKVNRYWNLNENYLKVDGFNLGDDGPDFDKINLQLQNTTDEIRANQGIYIQFNEDDYSLNVSKEYFDLNPLILSTGEKYEYKNDNKEDVLLSDKEKTNDELIQEYEGFDIYFYDEGMEFPIYSLDKFTTVKDPRIRVMNEKDNITYITHTLIPIIDDEETTKDYYSKILTADNAEDNIQNITTLDDEIINTKKEITRKILFLIILLLIFIGIYITIGLYIIHIYFLSNSKKIGIYKLYEIPRQKIYAKLYENLIFSFTILFMVLIILNIIKINVFCWIIILIFMVITEFVITKIYIAKVETQRVLETIKGE